MIPLYEGFARFRHEVAGIIAASPVVWSLALLGTAVLGWHEETRRSARFLGLFAACSLAAVCTGLRFSDHYFILLLPAASLLAAAFVTALVGTEAVRRRGLARALRVGIPVAAILVTVVRERENLFFRSPVAVSRAIYGLNPFPEAVEIARWIREHSDPKDRIAVIGSEPEIYFYARRRGATRYIYMYPLMEPHPFARQMQEEMIAEIQRARPRFMVLVNVDTSWTMRPDSSLRVLEWAVGAVNEGYQVVGATEIKPDGAVMYRWGPEASASLPDSRFHVVIFERVA
jgi:hypothetical protein